MKRQIILGVDPGTLLTGWGVIAVLGSHHNLLGCGVIENKQKEDPPVKYLKIFEEILSLIATYQIDALSVETQYVDKNVQSAIKLGMARGAILIAAAKGKVPVFEYTPSKAKLAVTGKGSSSKEKVGQMVRLLLSLDRNFVLKEDAADAIAIAITHAHYSRSHLCLHI